MYNIVKWLQQPVDPQRNASSTLWISSSEPAVIKVWLNGIDLWLTPQIAESWKNVSVLVMDKVRESFVARRTTPLLKLWCPLGLITKE